MDIVQEKFYIPDDISTKILTGEYKRIGGIVRYAKGKNKGRIVKHLDPVKINIGEKTQGVDTKLFHFARSHKKLLLISGAIMGVTVVIRMIYCKSKTREPVVLAKFKATLRVYISEIREGALKIETINDLMIALDDLKKHKDYEKFQIELSTEDLDVLVGRIYDYTIQLAENNNIELTELECSKSDNSILNLQNYLKLQKQVFEKAA